MTEILELLWLFLPALYGNAAPVFANHIPLLKKLGQPVDFGKSWRGARIFGDHKTWRGLLSGILVGAATGLLQMLLANGIDWFDGLGVFLDYRGPEPIWFGALLGLGALLADMIKSFFKRRRNVPSGEAWVPFDQIDFILGALLISAPFVDLSLRQMIITVLVAFLLHPIANVIGWLLKLKPRPF